VNAAAQFLTDSEIEWLKKHHTAVLVTIRRDGSPQTSNVAIGFNGTEAHVSVTAERAKTRNLQRDPRGVLHVLGDNFGQYASLAVDAVVGPVSVEPGDQAGIDLLALYESVSAKPHPDPDEFFAAMVTDHRLLLRLIPRSGRVWGIG
jgi:PPOX class probable F420-dependent enzyme